MEKRILGNTGIEATVLGYGAMEIRQGAADHRCRGVRVGD